MSPSVAASMKSCFYKAHKRKFVSFPSCIECGGGYSLLQPMTQETSSTIFCSRLSIKLRVTRCHNFLCIKQLIKEQESSCNPPWNAASGLTLVAAAFCLAPEPFFLQGAVIVWRDKSLVGMVLMLQLVLKVGTCF